MKQIAILLLFILPVLVIATTLGPVAQSPSQRGSSDDHGEDEEKEWANLGIHTYLAFVIFALAFVGFVAVVVWDCYECFHKKPQVPAPDAWREFFNEPIDIEALGGLDHSEDESIDLEDFSIQGSSA